MILIPQSSNTFMTYFFTLSVSGTDKPLNIARPWSLSNPIEWCSKSWLNCSKIKLPANWHTSAPSKQPMGTSKPSFPSLLPMVCLHWIIIFISDFGSLFSKLDGFNRQIPANWGIKTSLFLKLLNHSITLEVSFHSFTFLISCIWWLILSSISFLIFSIIDFKGFIKRHEILFGKSSLWFFIFISVSCSFSILSHIDRFFVILLAWLFTLFTLRRSDFLYVCVIFSFSIFLYSLWPNLCRCRDLSAETNTLSLTPAITPVRNNVNAK